LIRTTDRTRHLWEYDRPYYGADGDTVECASFAELREDVDTSDEDMNRIYRWDWVDHAQPYADDLFLDERCISWTCPISHGQEPEVLAWLRGPRVLGALRTLWASLLHDTEVTS
jgi:hypothetical protein